MNRDDYAELSQHIYQLEIDRRSWLAQLASAFQAQLEGSPCAIACQLQHERGGALTLRASSGCGPQAGAWIERLQAQLGQLRDAERRALFIQAPVCTRASLMLELAGLDDHDPAQLLGLPDSIDCEDIWLMYAPTTVQGATLIALPIGADQEPDVDAWQRLSGHLAEATRLRALIHDFSSWRDRALQQWAHRDPVEPSPPLPPSQATDLWEGLLQGHYQLMEQHDQGDCLQMVFHRTAADPQPARQLTPRERQVITQVARGMDNNQIGYALEIAAPTVATHLRSALDRLQIPNRCQLILLYQRLGAPACPA